MRIDNETPAVQRRPARFARFAIGFAAGPFALMIVSEVIQSLVRLGLFSKSAQGSLIATAAVAGSGALIVRRPTRWIGIGAIVGIVVVYALIFWMIVSIFHALDDMI